GVPPGRVVHRGAGPHFVEAAAVQIDLAQVAALRRDDPVAADDLAVRVEVAEQGVADGHLPHRAAVVDPAGDALGALDDDVLALGGLIGDAAGVAEAAVSRFDPLTVFALVHDDGV